MTEPLLYLEEAEKWCGNESISQRNNEESKGNFQHEATTTMLHW